MNVNSLYLSSGGKIKIKRRARGQIGGCLIKISRSTRWVDKYSTRSASHLSVFFFLRSLAASVITRLSRMARNCSCTWQLVKMKFSRDPRLERKIDIPIENNGEKGRERAERDPAPAITGCVFPSEISIDRDRLFHVPAYVNLIYFSNKISRSVLAYGQICNLYVRTYSNFPFADALPWSLDSLSFRRDQLTTVGFARNLSRLVTYITATEQWTGVWPTGGAPLTQILPLIQQWHMHVVHTRTSVISVPTIFSF